MKRIMLLSAIILTVIACSKDDDSPDEETNDVFNRQAMLVNWADKIIIPSYQSFLQDAEAMNADAIAFTADPSATNLEVLRTTWRAAYLSFQNVSMFEIGEAEQVRFRDRMNTYPVSTSEVDTAIANGNYDFALPSNNDSQGFPALDYMLYGVAASSDEIIQLYTGANGENYKAYLTDLTESITGLTNQVLTNWTGSFRDSFVNNDGSSASASVDKLTNDFIFYYEKSLRAGKIGIPAGVFSNDPLPGNVEGLYAADLSKSLALEALTATERFFKGEAFNGGQTGESYVSYLNFLNSIKNGEDLSGLITVQFATAKAKLNGLSNNFVTQIQNDNAAMLGAYDELQRNVVLLKVDMLQALSIDVDFVDADGD